MSLIGPEDLELLLGDPYDDANPHGFAAAVARDEREEFPEELCQALVRAGFHLNYLPLQWGGQLEAFDRSMRLVRCASRRDVNIMPGTMFSIIAATCLRLHGDRRQQDLAAGILRRGGAVGAALTEAGHGSDLLANEVRLTQDGLLSGEKWMVGLGGRCEAVYVLARTGDRGPGAFSALLLDLTDVPGEHFTMVPAPRTGGLRGIDLATMRFTGLPVPAEALVGRRGEGLEMAVKAQQVVRLMSMAGSLGCMDSALRLTLDFAAARTLGRATLTQVPYLRRELAIAAAAMLAADAVAVTAARGIHVLPETFSVWALSAKHAVAEAADELTRRCGTVLATRSVLRDGPGGAGMFQKLQRDCGVVRVIDASATANLRSYAAQLPALLTREADPRRRGPSSRSTRNCRPTTPPGSTWWSAAGIPCWAGWRQWRRRSPTRWPATRARQAPPTWSARPRRRGPGWRPRPGRRYRRAPTPTRCPISPNATPGSTPPPHASICGGPAGTSRFMAASPDPPAGLGRRSPTCSPGRTARIPGGRVRFSCPRSPS